MSNRANLLRWTLTLAIVLMVTAVPLGLGRYNYVENKRFREVAPGKVYRSGQMTADGFIRAVQRYDIRTIVNLQDEYPDPDIQLSVLGGGTIKETELCRRLGVRYVHLRPDLVSKREAPTRRPKVLDPYLAMMDDPKTYPVLLHCKAGLHRTGVLVAAYRMEYEGWSPRRALEDLRDNGFGVWASTAANDYIAQYLVNYRPGVRAAAVAEAD
jgi:hypothetical protein